MPTVLLFMGTCVKPVTPLVGADSGTVTLTTVTAALPCDTAASSSSRLSMAFMA